jgi:hypothetical protein
VGVRIRGDVGEGHGGGVMGGCCIHENGWRGVGRVVRRCSSIVNRCTSPTEEHLVLISLAPEVLQMLCVDIICSTTSTLISLPTIIDGYDTNL